MRATAGCYKSSVNMGKHLARSVPVDMMTGRDHGVGNESLLDIRHCALEKHFMLATYARAAFLALTPDPPDKTSVEFAEARLQSSREFLFRDMGVG